ncbi:UNVERIFIED_CONTAM: transcriptional regulator swi6 [Siphonaria sp. JEL0065]|nr:transcriptional regulator swi6 [Siphonaria sp. JEL0065]
MDHATTISALTHALFTDDTAAIEAAIRDRNVLLCNAGISEVCVDREGNTLHHWAATFANIPLLEAFSPMAAANYNRETPLMRCCMNIAAYDNTTFDQVLKAIVRDSPSFTSLFAADTQGRTVLHHIALSSGIKGRVYSARYYMDELVEFIDSIETLQQPTNKRMLYKFVNAQDVNGDTALNVAARMGDLNIVGSLVDGLKARSSISNNAGLRPKDFGVSLAETMNSCVNGMDDEEIDDDGDIEKKKKQREEDVVASLMELCVPRTPVSATHTPQNDFNKNINGKSPDSMDIDSTPSTITTIPTATITTIPLQQPSIATSTINQFLESSKSSIFSIEATIKTIHTQYNEIQSKTTHLLQGTKTQIAAYTKTLTQTRKKHESLTAQSHAIPLLKKRIDKLKNVSKACEKRRRSVGEAVEELVSVGCVVSTGGSGCEKSLSNCLSSVIIPSVTVNPPDGGKKVLIQMDALRGFIEMKEQEEKQYFNKIRELQSTVGPYEDLCKQVFSSCCNVPLEHSDQLIDPLLDWLDEQDCAEDE